MRLHLAVAATLASLVVTSGTAGAARPHQTAGLSAPTSPAAMATSAMASSKVTIPSKPTNSVVSVTPTTLQVTWGAPTKDGGSPLTGYTCLIAYNKVMIDVDTVSPSTFSCTITGLTPGKRYSWGVEATNAIGSKRAEWDMITLPLS